MAPRDPDASAGVGEPCAVQGSGPLDWHHLRATTLGDAALEREVLGLFLGQSRDIIAALKDRSGDAGALAHTLKGAARAIGAHGVAGAASRLEAAIRSESGAEPPLASDLVSRLAVEIDTVGEVIVRFLQDNHAS